MRWFPQYVNARSLQWLQQGLRWVNFFRRTDPVSNQPFLDATYTVGNPPTENHGDVLLADPASDRHLPGDPDLYIRGHSHDGYLSQSAFRRHRAAEIHRLQLLTRIET